jgi:hypothetical protein
MKKPMSMEVMTGNERDRLGEKGRKGGRNHMQLIIQNSCPSEKQGMKKYWSKDRKRIGRIELLSAVETDGSPALGDV